MSVEGNYLSAPVANGLVRDVRWSPTAARVASHSLALRARVGLVGPAGRARNHVREALLGACGHLHETDDLCALRREQGRRPFDAVVLVDESPGDSYLLDGATRFDAPLLLLGPGFDAVAGAWYRWVSSWPCLVDHLPSDAVRLRKRLASLLAVRAWRESADGRRFRALPDHEALRHARVLWAEDDKSLFEHFESCVQHFTGIQLERAVDGEDAWSRLVEAPGAYDLFLTDQLMPRRNGSEVLVALDPILSGVTPMVFESNCQFDELKEELAPIVSGVLNFVEECTEWRLLPRFLRKWLELRRAWQFARGLPAWPI